MRRKSQNWLGEVTLTQFGIIAVIGATTSIILGFAFEGRDMAPHMYAGAAAILLEAALVVFVIDRLTIRKKREEWAFVGGVVGRRMAACMVDIVRLGGISWSSEAFFSNKSRYAEFVRIAKLHFADLRSSIEGLALGAEPKSYGRARSIELRIDWLIDKFSELPRDVEQPPHESYVLMVESFALVGEFLDGTALAQETKSSIGTALAILAGIGFSRPTFAPRHDMSIFWATRMEAQDEVLVRRKAAGHREPGIWFDIDQDLALQYFAVDSVLLRGVTDRI